MDKHLQLRFVKKVLLIATPKVEMDDACVNAWGKKKGLTREKETGQ